MKGSRLIVWALAAGLTSGAFAADADWTQFRGRLRDGIAAGEKNLARSWPDGGPRIAWKRELGSGFAGIAVADGKLFTMFADGDKEFAGAFGPDDGQEVWRTAVGDLFENEFGNGPRSTPTIVDGKAYVLSSRGQLHALKADDGQVLWTVDLAEKYGAGVPTFGFSSAPLIDGDLLILEVGAGEGKHQYYAFDAGTGEERWGAGDGATAGYSSPFIAEFGGTTQYVFVSGGGKIFALDREGTELWSHEWPRGTIAMPVPVGKDRLFVSASSDVGGVMLKVKKGGEGFTVEEVWRNREMKNHFSSSVVVGNAIYGFDGATFKAISVKDGSRLWAKRGLGKGSLVAGDGLLFALSDRGQLVLVETRAKNYRQTGQIQVMNGKSWTAPTLVDGKLYVRNVDEMVCLDVKG